MFDLKGKVALVTGASSGLGLAYVKELLRNDVKGVALIDVDANKGDLVINEINKQYRKDVVAFFQADVTDRKQFEDAFQATIKTFKQLDIVINNAGIFQELQWEKCVAVNLVGIISGSILAMDHYLPKYRNRPEGVIINASSTKGLKVFEEGPTYSATKAGIVAFTRSLGGKTRYQTTKVKVIAVCPGYTFTGFSKVTAEQVNEPYLSMFVEGIKRKEPPFQTAETVAKYLMDIIKKGETGSVWNVTDECCSEVKFPQIV